jgi:hypothetical protein
VAKGKEIEILKDVLEFEGESFLFSIQIDIRLNGLEKKHEKFVDF